MSLRARLMILGAAMLLFSIAISVSPIPDSNFKDLFGGLLPIPSMIVFLVGWFQGFFQGD